MGVRQTLWGGRRQPRGSGSPHACLRAELDVGPGQGAAVHVGLPSRTALFLSVVTFRVHIWLDWAKVFLL